MLQVQLLSDALSRDHGELAYDLKRRCDAPIAYYSALQCETPFLPKKITRLIGPCIWLSPSANTREYLASPSVLAAQRHITGTVRPLLVVDEETGLVAVEQTVIKESLSRHTVGR